MRSMVHFNSNWKPWHENPSPPTKMNLLDDVKSLVFVTIKKIFFSIKLRLVHSWVKYKRAQTHLPRKHIWALRASHLHVNSILKVLASTLDFRHFMGYFLVSQSEDHTAIWHCFCLNIVNISKHPINVINFQKLTH